MVDAWMEQAERLVESRWDSVTRLAAELRRERVLSGVQVRQLLNQTHRHHVPSQ
jgi:hypothetical protein